MADVKLNIFGSAEAAEAAMVKLEKRIDSLEARTKKTGGESKKTGQAFQAAFSLGAVAATAFVGTLKGVQERLVQLRKESEQTFKNLERASVASAIQSGVFTKRASAGVRQRALNVSDATGVTADAVLAVAQAAESAGFSGAGTLQSGVTRKVLSAIASTGQQVDGVQARATTESLAALLNAQGLDLTSGNVGAQLARTRALQQSTKLQFEDLQQAANAAPIATAAGLKGAAFDAAFSVLRDEQTAERSATGLSAAVKGIVGDTAGSKRFRKALGLNAEDIDFQGETAVEVFDRINDALSKLDNPSQVRALEALGTAAVPAVRALGRAADSGELQKRIDATTGGEALIAKGLATVNQTQFASELRAGNVDTRRALRDVEGTPFVGTEAARQIAIKRIQDARTRRMANRSGVGGAILNSIDYLGGAYESVERGLGFDGSISAELQMMDFQDRERGLPNSRRRPENQMGPVVNELQKLNRHVRGKVDRNGQR